MFRASGSEPSVLEFKSGSEENRTRVKCNFVCPKIERISEYLIFLFVSFQITIINPPGSLTAFVFLYHFAVIFVAIPEGKFNYKLNVSQDEQISKGNKEISAYILDLQFY
ncbi:MAG: hypothetical protein MUO72_00810 [Bacteroidales bacterium]|nr:hypothetical protein [Bacteroidales bacterium]